MLVSVAVNTKACGPAIGHSLVAREHSSPKAHVTNMFAGVEATAEVSSYSPLKGCGSQFGDKAH
jgi:hypothetical protein